MASRTLVSKERRKEVDYCTKFELNKDGETDGYLEDVISRFPDEVLVSILSLLKAKEAGRTSVLSRRWRYLWTFIISLDFEGVRHLPKGLEKLQPISAVKPLRVEMFEFVQCVNQALKLHRGETIDTFKIQFDVGGECYRYNFMGGDGIRTFGPTNPLDTSKPKCVIERWIKFALEKKVKKLKLDLMNEGSFTLTLQFIRNHSFALLTALYLSCVDVTRQVLEHILSSCSVLEVLTVENARSLVNLEVSGSSLKLKYLEIRLCNCLEYIEISAPNLVYFKYSAKIIKISFKYIPCLVEASFEGLYACYFVNNIPCRSCSLWRSCLLSQLEMLVLDIRCERFHSFPKFPKLWNLKQLELVFDVRGFDSILHYMSLLKASPRLHRLVLKLEGLLGRPKGTPDVKKVKRPHDHLKVVELVGFLGRKIDIELAQYLLNKAVALRKLVIDPISEKRFSDKKYCEVMVAARTCARQLETSLPKSAELVIL